MLAFAPVSRSGKSIKIASLLWRGGEMADGPGGGHKINLLRKEVEDIIKEEEKR